MNSTIIHPDVWKYDLIHRTYTVEETARGSLTLIVVKKSGVVKGSIEVSGREGIWILRERIIGGINRLPCMTTTQRDESAIASLFEIGDQIFNVTTDSTQVKNSSGWA